MTHAVSTTSFRFDHMSPAALGLALLLHALAAAALWWMAQHRPPTPAPDTAIDVTIEQPPPPPPEPPKPDPPKPAEQAKLPPLEGLPPPADITADRRTQVPGSKEQPKNREPAEQLGPQTALATPQPAPKPEPPQRQPTPHPAPTLPPQQPQQPQVHQPPPPPARSPLTAARPQAPPPVANPGQGTTSPFVNPADTYNRALASDNYLWQVVRKLSGYRYFANVSAREGLTVVRVTIARDGRLIDVRVLRSSGYPEMDNGVVAGIRGGSPYSPLPPEIRGDSASFDLPLVSMHR